MALTRKTKKMRTKTTRNKDKVMGKARGLFRQAQGVVSMPRARSTGAADGETSRRRSRGMSIRKGKLFLGFSMKEVKAALRPGKTRVLKVKV